MEESEVKCISEFSSAAFTGPLKNIVSTAYGDGRIDARKKAFMKAMTEFVESEEFNDAFNGQCPLKISVVME